MKGKKPSVQVDQTQYKNYVREAEDFELAASDEAGKKRWNASSVLYIHAAIAWCDAMTICFGGKKSTGDNHLSAVSLLSDCVTEDPKGKKEALKSLRRVLDEKTAVSYMGESVDRKELETITKQYNLFSAWCRSLLKR